MLREVNASRVLIKSCVDDFGYFPASFYASAMRNAENIPVDIGDQIFMKLSDFTESKRIKS